MSAVGAKAPNNEPWSRFWYSTNSMALMGIPKSVIFPRPVTTQVPAFRIDENASAMCSPVVTPTVTIAASAPCPLVYERAISVASAIPATAWVAPNRRALSRLNSTGSTAMMWAAPACAAPCTALMPIPPMPCTMTVCPGYTSAELTAAPQPVPTPQPSRHSLSSGRSLSTLIAESTLTVVYSLNVDSPHVCATVDAVEAQPEARRIVGAAAGHDRRTSVAQVLQALRAPAAPTARSQEREHHVVALAPARGSGSDLHHDTGALVTAADRVTADRVVTGGDVVVGMAQPGGHHPDHQFAVARFVQLEVGDLVGTGCCADDRATSLHQVFSSGSGVEVG